MVRVLEQIVTDARGGGGGGGGSGDGSGGGVVCAAWSSSA